MGQADEIRAAPRAMWDTFSAGWEKWDPVVLDTNGPVGEQIVGALEIGESQQHLDIASGTGEPGLTIAATATHGRVVLTDISTKMLQAAERSAAAKGLENLEFRECSARRRVR